jgi:malate permease and related proteins
VTASATGALRSARWPPSSPLGESFSGTVRRGVWRQALRAVITMPALWAIVLALVWTGSGIPVPGFLMEATRILGNTVTGLMMLSLGMGLRYRRLHRPWPLLLASTIKLLVSPLVVLAAARLIGLEPPYLQAVVLEGAMPTQLLTFVIADFAIEHRDRTPLTGRHPHRPPRWPWGSSCVP